MSLVRLTRLVFCMILFIQQTTVLAQKRGMLESQYRQYHAKYQFSKSHQTHIPKSNFNMVGIAPCYTVVDSKTFSNGHLKIFNLFSITQLICLFVCSFVSTEVHLLFSLKLNYFFEVKEEGSRGREKETQAESVLSTETDLGLDLTNQRSQPELIPTAG